ncbi:aryl-phospho-beta-D-glucosidase BglC (GH1 family) [Pedobacter sp. CAN_A7]|uniref:cellulase family glycosylhydrolase n=1 Tax=Pedobacter sp. CAN_A7 TaxID=2787722 RepID=UPI0018CB4AEB
MKFKNIVKSGFCVALLLSCFFSSDVYPQGFLKTRGQNIVNEKNENILLRGMGLGGWMLQEGYMLGINNEGQQYKIRERIKDFIGPEETQKFYDTWLQKHTTRADIDAMKAWGFNSVRLPMHYNLYTLPIEAEPVAGKDTWLEQGFAMTDSLLAWCKANEMYLILDLHAAPGGQGNDFNISDRNPELPSLWDSAENQRKTVALWKKLAQRYKNESWIGAYDLINEPNWGFQDPVNDKNGLKEQKNEVLKKVLVNITKAIREVDQQHMIIIEGNGWGNNYQGMLPPWDDNMVLSFHKYWNYNNQESIKSLVEHREKYNVPVWLGETGENSNVWFQEAIALFERNNIGWCWWPLKKLGFNNPLEIKNNPSYQQVLNYWNKKGPKPKSSVAALGFKTLLENLEFGKNTVHHDVIDAMFRQVATTDTKPFKKNVLTNKTTLNLAAVDYDLGRNGYAYFDKDTADYHISTGKRSAGNQGRVYRNDGVDIQKDSTGTGYFVSNMEQGEWLQYTIQVQDAGTYVVKLEDTPASKGLLTIWLNQEESGEKLKLKPGIHQLKIRVDQSGAQLKNIQIAAL